MRDPASPHPCQHWMLSLCFILAFLIDVQWYVIMDLICIPLMATDVKYIFTRLSVLYTSPLLKCTGFLPIFEWNYLFFYCLESFSDIRNTNPLSVY